MDSTGLCPNMCPRLPKSFSNFPETLAHKDRISPGGPEASCNWILIPRVPRCRIATATWWPSFPDSNDVPGQPCTSDHFRFQAHSLCQTPLTNPAERGGLHSPFQWAVMAVGPGRWRTKFLSFLLCSVSKQCCLYLNKIALCYFLLVPLITAPTDHNLTSYTSCDAEAHSLRP